MIMQTQKVLIIDDEENMRRVLASLLKPEGYVVESAADGLEALRLLETEQFDIILCDLKMPRMGGMEFLKEIGARGIESTTIMMSAYGSVDDALKAMKNGAYDYISKPFKSDEIILTLKKAEEREKLRRENLQLRTEIQREFGFENIISKNARMLEIFGTIRKVAKYKSSVLFLGESGTGKELVARALHYNSPRSRKPFVAVNCGAIPENLLETELFGHLRGSFTDAVRDHKGLFVEAEQGTLFLDEIGEMPLALQVKLLRVLQEEELRPIGATRSIPVDVRIVTATARDLREEIRKGRFREDLYYRLNVVQIELPPLRERKEDLPLLVSHFLDKFARRMAAPLEGVDKEAMKILASHSWPGNIRELENTIERAIILSDGPVITPESLPARLGESREIDLSRLLSDDLSIKKNVCAVERALIRKALETTGGNRTRAAKILEISHRTLLYKMKAYQLS